VRKAPPPRLGSDRSGSGHICVIYSRPRHTWRKANRVYHVNVELLRMAYIDRVGGSYSSRRLYIRSIIDRYTMEVTYCIALTS
jgi:hypothetical protein